MTRLILISSGRVPTIVITLYTQRIPDVVELTEELLYTGHVQPARIMRRIVVQCGDFGFALGEIFRVVQAAIVGRNAVIFAKVHGPSHLLARDEGFVELLA